MPVIKSAIKKLRKDKNRTKRNDDFRKQLDNALRAAKKQKSAKAVTAAISSVDKAVKKGVMHQNRAARIKSSLSKLSKPAGKSPAKSPAKIQGVKTTKPQAKKSAKPAKK